MIKLGVKRWIVINDANVAHDLMVKRGSNYSARDHSYILCEIIHPGSRGMLAPSGDYWRKVRRLGRHRSLSLAFYLLVMITGREQPTKPFYFYIF